VSRDGRLVGIVSADDLAEANADAPRLAARALGGIAREGGLHGRTVHAAAAE